jgi:hypothetical protein
MKTPRETPQPGYEAGDARVGWVLAGVGVLVLGIVLSFATATALYRGHRQAGVPARAERLFQHGAVEESGIARDWKTQDAAVRRHLENYAWVDHGAGFVQIPIERAMELAVAETAATTKNSR